MKRRINENTKVTVTFGQLKRLVCESVVEEERWFFNTDPSNKGRLHGLLTINDQGSPQGTFCKLLDRYPEILEQPEANRIKTVMFNREDHTKEFNAWLDQMKDTHGTKWMPYSDGTIDEGLIVKESTEDDLQAVTIFASRAMFFSVLVHFWHLNCKRNGEHLALKDLYESLDDNADKLFEAVIGQTGDSVKITNPGIDFKAEFTDDSIGKIKELRSEASKLEASIEDNPGIANVLADIVEDCDSAIYKLTRLQ